MSDLAKLLDELQTAKRAETVAKGRRIEIEEQIVALVEDAPEKGSRTLKADNGLRCTVKFGFTVKADVAALRELDGVEPDDLPLKLKPATYEFDPKAYEALRKSKPDVARKIAAHVTTTPSKTGVELKL